MTFPSHCGEELGLGGVDPVACFCVGAGLGFVVCESGRGQGGTFCAVQVLTVGDLGAGDGGDLAVGGEGGIGILRTAV